MFSAAANARRGPSAMPAATAMADMKLDLDIPPQLAVLLLRPFASKLLAAGRAHEHVDLPLQPGCRMGPGWGRGEGSVMSGLAERSSVRGRLSCLALSPRRSGNGTRGLKAMTGCHGVTRPSETPSSRCSSMLDLLGVSPRHAAGITKEHRYDKSSRITHGTPRSGQTSLLHDRVGPNPSSCHDGQF